MAGVALLLATGYVAVAAAHGALGAARNDDWLYYRSLFTAAETGSFQGDAYTLAFLAGQIYLALPLAELIGPSLAPFQVLVAALGALGLWATYDVVRAFLSRTWALFSVGVLALGPIYGAVGVTFMTDVPSFALQAGALCLALRALNRPQVSGPLLSLSLTSSVLAFTVREFAIVSAAAILLTWVWRAWPLSRRTVVAVAATVVVLAGLLGLLLVWRASVTPVSNTAVLVPRGVRASVRELASTAMTLVELMAPALVLGVIAVRPLVRRARLAVVLGLVGAAIVGWLAVRGHVNANYVTPQGPYPETSGPGAPEAYPVWAGRIKQLVLLVAAAGGAILVASWFPRTREDRPRLSPGIVLSAVYGVGVISGACLLDAVAGVYAWDRYLIPAVPYLAAVVVVPLVRLALPRLKPVLAAVLAAWFVVGFHYVDLAATQDGTRWRLAETLLSQGYPAETIDGGLEWFGLHQRTSVAQFPSSPPVRFWTGLFPGSQVCVVSHYPGAPFPVPPGATPRVVATRSQTSALGVSYTLVADEVETPCRPPGSP